MNEGKSWLVERDCCTSGNCIECGKTPFGKTIRVVQLDRLSEEKARQVAENWKAYKAVARNTLLGI
jgi:hypothetical protein